MSEKYACKLRRYLPALAGLKCRILFLVSLAVSGSANGDNLENLEAALKVFSQDELVPAFKYALVDLDGDNQLDAVVILSGSQWCGSGGCTMVVMQGTKTGFKYISDSTITNEPILVLREQRHGWRTLVVSTHSVGAVLMRFNGHKYPNNPSMQLSYIADRFTGIQLLRMIAVNTPKAPSP